MRLKVERHRQEGGDLPAHEQGGRRTVGYMPALDGLRALAVLGVMAYHGGVSFLPAGFFGVDAFFVLSGFLITSLLVTEWSSQGQIALGAFWARRARRLLPALIVMIVFVLLYARFVATPGMYPGLRGDSLSALFYFANWHFIVSGTNYFAQSGPVSPLLHTWSLAIEEQFYILWPLLVLGLLRLMRRSRRRQLWLLLAVTTVGAVASAIEMAILFVPGADPTRVYFGTDTHAQCLLVGAALATFLAMRKAAGRGVVETPLGRFTLSALGISGVVVCAWAWSHLHDTQALVFRGGFLIVSLGVAGVIASAVLHPAGIVARSFAMAPLRFIGRISYGMYLWHFPIDIALTASRTGLQGWNLFVFRTLVTVSIATVSFYGLERPIRSGRVLGALGARIATPVAMIGMVGVVLASTAAFSPAVTGLPASRPVGSSTTQAVPAQFAHAPVRVMLVGDSVAWSLGVGLIPLAHEWNITISNRTIFGCGVAQVARVWSDLNGSEESTPLSYACRTYPTHGYVPWDTAWRSWLTEAQPNVIVLLAGRWEVTDTVFGGRVTNILNPAYAAYVKRQLEYAVVVGTSTGAHMVLMTSPCFDEGEQPNGSPFPEDSLDRVAEYNKLVGEVGAEFPNKVTVQDLYALTCPDGKFEATLRGAPFRPDGIHFAHTGITPETGSALLARQLLPLWENLGQEQEAAGGKVVTTPLPDHFSVP